MSKIIDMVGKKCGRLTVVSRSSENEGTKAQWVCLCDCGNTKIVTGDKLRRGHTQSCGCLHSDVCAALLKTHGYSSTPTHTSWAGMKQRCFDPNATSYPRYGACGITVCDRWVNSFENFLADMGERPDGYSLDRIDPEKNYEPGNCRWATDEEQANNKKNNRRIDMNGRLVTVAEASRLTGIPGHILYRRVSKGWSDFDVVSIPVLRHKRNR